MDDHQFLTKGSGIYQEAGAGGLLQAYLMGLIDPFGTLWFNYMLAVFLLVVRALRHVPPLAVFAVAALLEMAPVETGWVLADEFAARFVYFFAGYWMAERGWSQLPGIGLALGFIGAAAVVSLGVWLSQFRAARAIGYCGENSIVIYLAFFLFMAGSRGVLMKFVLRLDTGVIGPVPLYWAVRNTRLSFLFQRPLWARLATGSRGWHSAAHADISSSQAR